MPVSAAIITAATSDALIMCPDLSTIPPAAFTIIVARAACLIQPDAWKKKQQPALGLLICHYGFKQLEIIAGGAGIAATGPVTSVSIGGKLAVSYGSISLSKTDIGFTSTEWGIEYLQLKDTLIIPPLAANSGC